MKEIKVQAEICVPSIPNFLRYPGGKISIAHLENDDLIKIANAWKEELLSKAEKIRN